MTRVSMFREGDTLCIRADRHASGSTEVCAAASCLMYTLAGWVEQSADRGNYEIGDASAIVRLKDGEAAAEIFSFARIGFRQLAASYPKFIRITRDAK